MLCSRAERAKKVSCTPTFLNLNGTETARLLLLYTADVGGVTSTQIRCMVLTVFTAQCTLVQMHGLGIACRPSVCPSVCL